MKCPSCNTKFAAINDLEIDEDGGAGKVAWYQYEPPKRLRCPECKLQLELKTPLTSAVIALVLLTIGLLNILYPNQRVLEVLFIVSVVALGVGIPTSIKYQAVLLPRNPAQS